jgi:predicted transcriptional regulator of viral defense system
MKDKFKLIGHLVSNKKRYVTTSEISTILQKDRLKVNSFMHSLEKEGVAERVEKGKYFLNSMFFSEAHHPFLLPPLVIERYFISFHSLLSFYNLIPEPIDTIYVCTPNRKRNLSFHGYKYKFFSIKEENYFGYEEIEIQNHKVKVAQMEMLLINCLQQEEYAGGMKKISEVFAKCRERIDRNRLINYALKIGNQSLMRRLGYIMDKADMKESKTLEKNIGNFRAVNLSTISAERIVRTDKKWKLNINVDSLS